MRKLILIAIVFFIASCSVQREVVFVDYSGYDCFITESNSVSFEYKPLGSVIASITNFMQPGPMSYNFNNSKVMTNGNALRETIKLAVRHTKEKGGDGIINFKYEPVYKGGHFKGWTVSGMAIKTGKEDSPF